MKTPVVNRKKLPGPDEEMTGGGKWNTTGSKPKLVEKPKPPVIRPMTGSTWKVGNGQSQEC